MTTAEIIQPIDLQIISRPPRSPLQDAIRSLFHNRSAVLGMVLLSILVLVALSAPILAPYPPNQVLIGVEKVGKRAAPCIHLLGCPASEPQHLMGTDGNV